jgi:hypothetical protein
MKNDGLPKQHGNRPSGQRKIMLARSPIFIQCADDRLQVPFIPKEVSPGRIHEQCLHIVLPDVVGIGLLDIRQVFVGNGLLVRSVPLSDILLKPRHRRMQVDKDIRLGDLLVDDIEKPLIEPEFILRQVHLRKEQALGEEIIRDGDRLEQIRLLRPILLLLESFCHEEKLQWKGVLAGILIEFRQEGVVGKFLQDEAGVVMLRQQVREGCLSRADIAFDGDERILHAGRKLRQESFNLLVGLSTVRAF